MSSSDNNLVIDDIFYINISPYIRKEIKVTEYNFYIYKLNENNYIQINYQFKNKKYKLIIDKKYIIDTPNIYKYMNDCLNLLQNQMNNKITILSAEHNNNDITNKLNEYFEPILNRESILKKYIRIKNKQLNDDISIILSDGSISVIKKEIDYIKL
tara:strand:+ start:703 stop:1170 length:468 start_codon:yes stop_codon:yes gene_type:complete